MSNPSLPTFEPAASGGGAPSGPAAGDLSGTYPNPGVAKVVSTTPGAEGLALLAATTAAAAWRIANPVVILTPSAGAVTWTPNTDGLRAKMTLAADTTLTLTTTGMVAGDELDLLVIQGASPYELTFPSTCILTPGPRQANGALTRYLLRFDGTNFVCTVSFAWRERILSGTSLTITPQHHLTKVRCTSASATAITLPDLATYPGLLFSIIRDGVGVVTVSRAGSDTIRGVDQSATAATSFIVAQDEAADIHASTASPAAWWRV